MKQTLKLTLKPKSNREFLNHKIYKSVIIIINLMTRYYCKVCGYKFEPKTDRVPTVCPYCGRKGTLVKEGTAQDLINEAIKEDFED